MDKLIITPKTKIYDLLEAYPQLEDVLIEYASAFKKLKNPILRKTIARITTLQQASAIGEVKVEEIINRLRKEVGQDAASIESEAAYIIDKPIWFDENKIAKEFDVSDMLAAGEHPVSQVISDLKTLKANEIYKMTAPFLTAPLIDKATSLDFKHWVNKINEQLFEIYFSKD
jgi:hypothetical protein